MIGHRARSIRQLQEAPSQQIGLERPAAPAGRALGREREPVVGCVGEQQPKPVARSLSEPSRKAQIGQGVIAFFICPPRCDSQRRNEGVGARRGSSRSAASTCSRLTIVIAVRLSVSRTSASSIVAAASASTPIRWTPARRRSGSTDTFPGSGTHTGRSPGRQRGGESQGGSLTGRAPEILTTLMS
jgi:hypothetical protein